MASSRGLAERGGEIDLREVALGKASLCTAAISSFGFNLLPPEG